MSRASGDRDRHGTPIRFAAGRRTHRADGEFVVIRPAVLDASGTRMDVDVPMPGAAAVRTRIGGKGGEIALSATAGLYLDGDMRAAGGTPDAPGGKLASLGNATL